MLKTECMYELSDKKNYNFLPLSTNPSKWKI